MSMSVALQAIGRDHLLHRARQGVGRRAQPLDLVAAVGALLHVELEGPLLVVGERAEQIRAAIVAEAVVVRAGHAISPGLKPASWCRIFSRPSRIRPLTVPSGMPSISAIWLWLKPPKYASSIVRR